MTYVLPELFDGSINEGEHHYDLLAPALLREAFNPDEPRDEGGKWTAGAGAGPRALSGRAERGTVGAVKLAKMMRETYGQDRPDPEPAIRAFIADVEAATGGPVDVIGESVARGFRVNVMSEHLYLQRTFTYGAALVVKDGVLQGATPTLSLDVMKLDPSIQGKGIGAKLLAATEGFARAAGAKRLELGAESQPLGTENSRWVGAYVWPHMGGWDWGDETSHTDVVHRMVDATPELDIERAERMTPKEMADYTDSDGKAIGKLVLLGYDPGSIRTADLKPGAYVAIHLTRPVRGEQS